MNLEGKKILVTGSTLGIGRGIAESLLQAGAKVAINARREESEQIMDEFRSFGECVYIRGDLSSSKGAREVVDTSFEELGGLDFLINNAGTFADIDFLELDDEHFDKTFNLNVKGYLFATQQFARLVGQREFDAGVICVGSTNSLQAEKGGVIYDCSKGAILMMIRSLAVSLAEKGIRSNGIGPGFVRTPLTENAINANPEIVDILEAQIPQGRIGQYRDCGGAAVFLCSEAAQYVNGQMIYVDGGILAQQMIWEKIK